MRSLIRSVYSAAQPQLSSSRRCISQNSIRDVTSRQFIGSIGASNVSIGISNSLTTNAHQCTRIIPPSTTNTPLTIQTLNFTSKSKQKMIPRKAALNLTPKARETFRKLISATDSVGILLKYEISSQHALRMAFKFDLIKDLGELSSDDEGVSLEILSDGKTPKPPSESWNDNLPKLYIHSGAFMKVLGGTLDVDLNTDTGELKPKLFDREGHEMDPNA